MSAYIYYDKNQPNLAFTWYVQDGVEDIQKHLPNIWKVQTDGHEAQMLYGVNLKLNGNYVHTLEGNEAKMWALIITNDKGYRHKRDWIKLCQSQPEQLKWMSVSNLLYYLDRKFKESETENIDYMKSKLFEFIIADKWDMVASLLF